MASNAVPRINRALEPCETDCVPFMFKNEDPNVMKQCEPERLQHCYQPRKTEDIFYKAISWQNLYKYLQYYMDEFARRVSQDLVITELMQKVYTYGPYPPEKYWGKSRPKNYALFEATIVKNDNYEHCKDIIVKLVINRGAAATPKPTSNIIAHISLHPKQPVYYREELRSRSGCGFYFRPPGYRPAKGEESHPTDTGPFHYAINSLGWAHQLPSDQQPAIQFLVDQENPGNFLPMVPDEYKNDLTRIPLNVDKKIPGEDGIILDIKKKKKTEFEERNKHPNTKNELESAEAQSAEEDALQKKAEEEGLSPEIVEQELKKIRRRYGKLASDREKEKKITRLAEIDIAVEEGLKRYRAKYYRESGNIGENESNNVGLARVEEKLLDNHRELLFKFHSLLYREFIDFWNGTMVPLKPARPVFFQNNNKKIRQVSPVKKYGLKFTFKAKPVPAASNSASASASNSASASASASNSASAVPAKEAPRLEELLAQSIKVKAKAPNAIKNDHVVLNLIEVQPSDRVVYSGFFLPNEVSQKLFLVVASILEKTHSAARFLPGYIIQAGHLTMNYGEDSSRIFERIKYMYPENPIPLQVTSIVSGKISGEPLVAVTVALPPPLVELCQSENPHITVYHAPTVKPMMSNDLLLNLPPPNVTEKTVIPFEMEVPTSVGMFVSVSKKGGTRKTKRFHRKTRKLHLRTNKHK